MAENPQKGQVKLTIHFKDENEAAQLEAHPVEETLFEVTLFIF